MEKICAEFVRNNPNSTIIDSISISPQECYTLDILHGAGSLNGTIGDVIFHCHLYPHFHEGMWTLWRIYDRLEDGTGRQPDGTVIQPLMPLKDRIAPLRRPHERIASGILPPRPSPGPYDLERGQTA